MLRFQNLRKRRADSPDVLLKVGNLPASIKLWDTIIKSVAQLGKTYFETFYTADHEVAGSTPGGGGPTFRHYGAAFEDVRILRFACTLKKKNLGNQNCSGAIHYGLNQPCSLETSNPATQLNVSKLVPASECILSEHALRASPDANHKWRYVAQK